MPDGFTAEGLYLPPRVSPDDPLAQRSYLAIKLTGSIIVGGKTKQDALDAIPGMLQLIRENCEVALKKAVEEGDGNVEADLRTART